MKVLLVCSYSFKSGQTGDATQGRETASALRAAGVEVVRAFIKYLPLRVYDVEDKELSVSELQRVIDSCDIVHLLPGTKPLCKFWRQFRQRPVVASSIFWGGWERSIVAFNTHQGLLGKCKFAIKEIRNMSRLYQDYRGVDVFLPNSDAEGRCVMRHYRTNADATYRVVPNGFVPPKFNVWELPRSANVPEADYIVVPGAFAPRKNQLGLIRAMKHDCRCRKVVFMGGEHDAAYFARCRKEASIDMVFLGFISSRDEEYWKVLRHARVACLPSDCETPGIAMIEAAYAGARPVITKFGGTKEYYGDYGEYLNPCFSKSIISALNRGWDRGRLAITEASSFTRFSWELVAEKTIEAYRYVIQSNKIMCECGKH